MKLPKRKLTHDKAWLRIALAYFADEGDGNR
jgi:hypothetical protein